MRLSPSQFGRSLKLPNSTKTRLFASSKTIRTQRSSKSRPSELSPWSKSTKMWFNSIDFCSERSSQRLLLSRTFVRSRASGSSRELKSYPKSSRFQSQVEPWFLAASRLSILSSKPKKRTSSSLLSNLRWRTPKSFKFSKRLNLLRSRLKPLRSLPPLRLGRTIVRSLTSEP